jgi:hypothetical protein
MARAQSDRNENGLPYLLALSTLTGGRLRDTDSLTDDT